MCTGSTIGSSDAKAPIARAIVQNQDLVCALFLATLQKIESMGFSDVENLYRKSSPFKQPMVQELIGGGVLHRFKIIFDYTRQRMIIETTRDS